MKKDPLIFIKHILESIEKIGLFCKDFTKDKLKKDDLRQSAIVRELEVIGEAVKNLPKAFRERYRNIEWKKLAGLRDKLIHHYFGIDLDIIWEVLEKDLPKLKKNIIFILSKEKNRLK